MSAADKPDKSTPPALPMAVQVSDMNYVQLAIDEGYIDSTPPAKRSELIKQKKITYDRKTL
ncbi:MAG: hypothetical protein OEL57_08165 [Trichlorobacter sp.]|uniref:hypothetical protein n=1 Tax=Trichlorobacter sp. TaxID=2911007 RepID=UPI002565D78C|nr:hypothetical protein [Trichlorobacter sp.]MDK9717867.1 hypothetical protein [Trichlorobacter sp.]